jgi:hypothetical protein
MGFAVVRNLNDQIVPHFAPSRSVFASRNCAERLAVN